MTKPKMKRLLFNISPVICFVLTFVSARHFPEPAHQLVNQIYSLYVNDTVISVAMTAAVLAVLLTALVIMLQVVYLVVEKKTMASLFWLSSFTVMLMGGTAIYLQVMQNLMRS